MSPGQKIPRTRSRGDETARMAGPSSEPKSRRHDPEAGWSERIFGVVPPGSRRRRPGDIARVVLAGIAVLLTARAAEQLTTREQKLFDLLYGLPGVVRTAGESAYWIGIAVSVGVMVAALLIGRRFRLLALLGASGSLGFLVAEGLQRWTDVESARRAAGVTVDGRVPTYPVVALVIATTIVHVAAPYLLRSARRLVFAMLMVAAVGAAFALIGLADDVIASVAIGWGVAALAHLVIGTPAATPSTSQVDDALASLGVAATHLRLSDRQVWGETRYEADATDGTRLSILVIGRDAADARMLSRLWRFVWFRESAPSLTLTRTQRIEHQAYVMLFAARSGAVVGEVVAAGIGGARQTAVLAARDPAGIPLAELEPTQVTDSVLDDAWEALARLHGVGIAHGRLGTETIMACKGSGVGFVDFAQASTNAPTDRRARDAVGLLATTTPIVGVRRALAAAHRALGNDGLSELLPLLEPAALEPTIRRSLADDPDQPIKELLGSLREQGAELVGTEVVALAKLQRVTAGSLLLAAATILGVYLLVGELSQVDYATVFDDAQWGWVLVAFVLAPLPQLTGAVALKGAVTAPLPTRPVIAEQFANNFTGLIGGTVATTALVIRFFQKQGLKVAVAASSGVLNSLAGFAAQASLVFIGLLFTGDEFTPTRTGGRNIAGIAIALLIIVVILASLAVFVPRLRKWAAGVIRPQWDTGRENLVGILRTPRKAVMLFGGNVGSQILFALAISASLRAYGQSLPLLQIIVINSFASFVGGMAPVPGGMGVVEAGLIAGFTAAGLPKSEAVAATFTYRTFTAYLPPIWGWFALRWLRRHEYV